MLIMTWEDWSSAGLEKICAILFLPHLGISSVLMIMFTIISAAPHPFLVEEG